MKLLTVNIFVACVKISVILFSYFFQADDEFINCLQIGEHKLVIKCGSLIMQKLKKKEFFFFIGASFKNFVFLRICFIE